MLTLTIIIAIALIFDFCNGFHDAANSIATVVATRVLRPQWAVLWTALFNFFAFLIFPLHVAHTIGEGILPGEVLSDAVVAGALAGAIGWDLLTWWWGLPSSSSHALVGGLVGAGAVKAGFSVIQLKSIAHRVLDSKAEVPLWVVLACHAAMGLGTLAGGWRVVRTMGMRLTKLKPVHGFAAETAGAAALFLSTILGIPVSTTHTITGGIVGVGSVTQANTVKWNVALRVVWAWLFTIQVSALLAAGSYLLLRSAGLPD